MKTLTKEKLRLFCIVFLLVDLLIVAVLACTIASDRRAFSSRRDALARRIGITAEMDAAEQEERFAVTVGDASRLVTNHSEVTAEDGFVPIFLSNSAENTCGVAMELVLAETGETIASCGLVEPGWRLEWMELEKDLPGGIYHCLGRCSFYIMDGNVFLGQSARQILLTVE